MDSRRLPCTVIDPKVRQVGFFTSGDPPPGRSQFIPTDPGASAAAATGISLLVSEISLPSNSLSPVMIPPFRHSSVGRLPSHARIAVPGYMSPRRREGLQMPIGSYNSSENFLGMSPMLSPSRSQLNGSDLSEVGPSARLARSGSGKVASSFPGSTGEMMMVMSAKNGGNASADISLRNASVVKTLPGVTEKDEETRTHSKNEGAKTGGKKKQTTTRAERRALQDAQRAAKGAGMENGNVFVFYFLSMLIDSP